jgi:hypothetical protein
MIHRLVRVALAFAVFAPAIDIRRLFHGLALGAAILSRCCHAGTNWVCTLLDFRGVHLLPPDFESRAHDLDLYVSRLESIFLYRKEHVLIFVGSKPPTPAMSEYLSH